VAHEVVKVYAADKSLDFCLRFISASSISALLRLESFLGLDDDVRSALSRCVLSAL